MATTPPEPPDNVVGLHDAIRRHQETDLERVQRELDDVLGALAVFSAALADALFTLGAAMDGRRRAR